MKLVSLKMIARGVNGWESPVLAFGKRTTSLFAPNGSGKTPLIQAIAFCLGLKIKFREDINNKCSAACLVIEHEGKLLEIQRSLDRDFHAEVRSADKGIGEYFSEGDFSKSLFETFGLTAPLLVSTDKHVTQPYLSTVLPLFYVKQDGGYIDAYKAPSSFIVDQFVEMVRFVFGLNPKHSYEAKKDLLNAKDAIDAVNRKLVFQQKVITDLAKEVDDSPAVRDNFDRRIASHIAQLEQLRGTVDAHGSANSVLLELLQSKDEQIRAARNQKADLLDRIGGIDSIRAEIEGEIQTLSLNEESRGVFDSFNELCGNQNCRLFVGSSESYAKNLLYLKDQLKDLQRNVERAETRLSDLDIKLNELEAERAAVARKVAQPSLKNGVDQLISAVQLLTKELVEAEQSRGTIDILSAERSKYIKLDDERSRIQDRIELLTNNGRSDIEFNKLRIRIRDLTVKWMDILDTPNASRDIDIDLGFKFKFGNDPLEVFIGSTKIRLVLAIHAAIFEDYLSDSTRAFRFLILDTPKQHEMHTQDLSKYVDELERVCETHNAQILLSSTEYRHLLTDKDVEWLPQYPGEKQTMYLGA